MKKSAILMCISLFLVPLVFPSCGEDETKRKVPTVYLHGPVGGYCVGNDTIYEGLRIALTGSKKSDDSDVEVASTAVIMDEDTNNIEYRMKLDKWPPSSVNRVDMSESAKRAELTIRAFVDENGDGHYTSSTDRFVGYCTDAKIYFFTGDYKTAKFGYNYETEEGYSHDFKYVNDGDGFFISANDCDSE